LEKTGETFDSHCGRVDLLVCGLEGQVGLERGLLPYEGALAHLALGAMAQ